MIQKQCPGVKQNTKNATKNLFNQRLTALNGSKLVDFDLLTTGTPISDRYSS